MSALKADDPRIPAIQSRIRVVPDFPKPGFHARSLFVLIFHTCYMPLTHMSCFLDVYFWTFMAQDCMFLSILNSRVLVLILMVLVFMGF